MALKSRLTQLKSKAKAAPVDDIDEDQEDEVVTTKAPVKKLGGLKGLKAKAAPEPEDEDLDDEDQEDEDDSEDEEEVVAKPAAKKTLGKKLGVKAKPAPEPEEDEDDEDEDDEEQEEEVVAKPAAKKTLGKKPAVKAAPEPEEDDEDSEDEEEQEEVKPVAKKGATKKPAAKSEDTAAKKTLFNSKTSKKERVLEENSILTRDELASRLAAKRETSLVDAREMLSDVEDILLEAIQKYQLNFLGVRFKRRLQAQRDHSGVGGIDLGDNNYKAELVTRVFPHYVATLRVNVGDRQVAKGIMRDEEFVEGNFNDNGDFVEGTWHTPAGTKNPVFTPSTPRAGKVVKKGKK